MLSCCADKMDCDNICQLPYLYAISKNLWQWGNYSATNWPPCYSAFGSSIGRGGFLSTDHCPGELANWFGAGGWFGAPSLAGPLWLSPLGFSGSPLLGSNCWFSRRVMSLSSSSPNSPPISVGSPTTITSCNQRNHHKMKGSYFLKLSSCYLPVHLI